MKVFRPLIIGAAVCLTLATLGASRACAQAMLTFSGGNNAPVTYVIITAGAANFAPIFDFQGVGNLFGISNSTAVSGTVTFTINGGAAQTLTKLGSGSSAGSVAATDSGIFGSLPGVAVGNTAVLTAGTLTTTANLAGAPPASMSYPTFIFDGNGTKLDAVNGASVVPEPSTWALLGVGAASSGIVAMRRRAAVFDVIR